MGCEPPLLTTIVAKSCRRLPPGRLSRLRLKRAGGHDPGVVSPCGQVGTWLASSPQSRACRETIERTLVRRGTNPCCGIAIGSINALVGGVQRGLGAAIAPLNAGSPPAGRDRAPENRRPRPGAARWPDSPSPGEDATGRALAALVALIRPVVEVV